MVRASLWGGLPLVALVIGCGESGPTSRCLQLDEVRRYGYSDLIENGLERSAVAAGGGVLGQIRGILPGTDGAVYVLDRYWQKVVVFAPDGTLRRVIRAGEGEGPGEFVTPIDLTATVRGFSVLDYELNRITEFSCAGELLGTIQLETGRRPWRHLIRGDTVWIAYSSGGASADPVFYRTRITGESLDSGPPLPKEHQPYGTTVGLAFGNAGEVLLTTARPGVWISHTNQSWSTYGQPLFAQDRAPVLEQVGPRESRLTPAQHNAAGIGAIGDSIIVQGIHSYERPFDWRDPPARDEVRRSVGVFSPTGTHVATIPLPHGVGGAVLTTDRAAGRVFADALEPFPQVVEFRLAECTSRS